MATSLPQSKSPGLLGVWEHFTLADGLPDLKIECLFADSRGNLWVGTRDRGAARFDRERFETFTTRDGLAGDGVFSIIEDREGALWFGTLGGLSRYDGKRFETIQPRSGERCGYMWGSCLDGEGRLWFGVAGRPGIPAAVCRWEGKGLELIRIEDSVALPSTHASLTSIYAIVASPGGDVYFGGGALYHYDGAQLHCLARATDPREVILSMLWRPSGEMWCVLNSGELKAYADSQFHFLRSGVCGLAQDPSGAVWLTTWNEGVLRCDGDAFQVIQKTDKPLGGNPCLDSEGRLWFHGPRSVFMWGISCYDTTRFEVLQKEQGLPATDVNCLAEDEEGRIVVGTSAGIVVYDGHQFQPLEQAEALAGRPISALVREGDRLWINTLTNFYVHAHGALRPSAAPGIPCSGVISLAGDRKGGVYFGYEYPQVGFGFGYYKDEQVRVFPFDPAYPSQVGELLVDQKGHLWVGSRCADTWDGVCCYDGERFTPFTRADGLAGGSIYALFEDREGGVWIGTTEGASRFDGGEFRTFTQEDGLPPQTIRIIAQTRDGKMWFGTQGGGLGLFDGEVFQIIQIPGNPPANWINAIHQDRKGQLWFGTEGGLVRYTPQQVPPEVALTEIIADQTYAPGRALEIPTTAGRISFCFQGKSVMDRASRLVYRYRLEGHDSHWRQTRERQVDYPQLQPGEYCFQVKAVDTDLNYSPAATVKVKITEDLRLAGLTEVLRVGGGADPFIGQSRALRQVEAELAQVALTDLTVLILGETGTGKGLAASLVHARSARCKRPFIQVNCGAIPRELVESELFGHERGAFTGAISRKLGKFELAESGTLFLDEIGDLPLDSQAALLQFLQEKTFQRVGGQETLRGEVRIIAATNRDLHTSMAKGLFRQDLFYRLSAFVVELPPLRQRREDILPLMEFFAARFARHLDRPTPSVSPEALERLEGYDWPGNVRELEHLVQRAVLLCKDRVIREEEVAVVLHRESPATPQEPGELDLFERLLEKAVHQGNGGQHNLLKTTEEMVVRAALARSQGNRRKAAALLGVDRKKVERSVKKYRLPDNGAASS